MTAVSRRSAAAPAVFTVERLRDPAAIRTMLESERAYSAYALAQLDPAAFPFNEWVFSRGPAGRQALLVHSRGGLGPALFAIGDAAALDAAIGLHPGPRYSFGSLRLEHKRVVEKYFLMMRPQIMQRMQVTPSGFQPAPGRARRLRGADVGAVNRLYSMEGGATAYRPEHLDRAVYYGVFTGDELVSIAGTHVVSAAERTAVVGNVFTHPRRRGIGLATMATSAVTEHLLGFCDLIALTVEVTNTPAVRIYEKLGYTAICNLHETPLVRKAPLGVLSYARRAIAGWRGRRQGKEVVVR